MRFPCFLRLRAARSACGPRARRALRRAALAAAVFSSLAATPDPDATRELHELRSELTSLRQLVERLERRLSEQEPLPSQAGAHPAPGVGAGPAPDAKTAEQRALEEALAKELAPTAPGGSAAAAASAQPAAVVRGGDRNYLNLSFDALVAGGTSTTPDVASIETGGHDPSQRGFTVQNVEMVLEGAVDPYFRGQGNLVFQIDAGGETVVELEEAYLTTTSLPNNLQVKAGQFFSEFGRLNPQHPHTWDFADQPLVNGRFLGGDGLRGPGARGAWLVPTPFYSELLFSAQNSQGETAFSFRNAPGETQFGRPVVERDVRSLDDMVYVPRYTASFDLSETQTLLLGVSGALGPNGSGRSTSTQIWGTDFFWKWKSPRAEAGFPFVKWQTEVMQRRFAAGPAALDTDDDGLVDTNLPSEKLRDWGAYSQIVWGFARGWTAGLRGDYVRGNRSRLDPDPTRGTHWRVSPNLTWFPTEFSKFRIQLNHDDVEGMGSDESLWVQMEFILGAHAAHKF
jgi:hypothetical protein